MNPLVSSPECSDVGDMWAQGCADRGPSGGTQRYGRRKRAKQVPRKNRSKYDKDGVTVEEKDGGTVSCCATVVLQPGPS